MRLLSPLPVLLVAIASVPVAGAALAAPSASPSGMPAPKPSGSHARETPEQRDFRKKYTSETIRHEVEIAKGHVWTPEMHKITSEHWRRAYKALRIRDLAQDDNDSTSVGRADAFLKKIDAHFFPAFTDAASKSPTIPAAPTIAAPAAGASIAVGTPVAIKLAPVKDAVQYHCALFESGPPTWHLWSNWNASSKAYSTTPECTVAADDPRWAKFHAGGAVLHAHALFAAKSSTGKDYKYWSDGAKINVTVTGGAAPPTPSGAPAPKPSGGTK